MSLIPSSSTSSEKTIDGITILYQSAKFFDAALKQFRICHDLAISSEILDKVSIAEMDACAVDFRKISAYCTSLSEKVASVWCGTSITFYRNLEKVQDKNPSKVLLKISANSSELSAGFTYLSEKAEGLAVKFQKLNVGSLSMQDKFVKAFKEEEERIEQIQKRSHMELEGAKQTTVKLSMEQQQKERSFLSRAKHFIYREDYQELAEAAYMTKTAKEREAQLQAEFEEIQRKLAAQTSQTKKAEVVAAEIAKLMNVLEDVTSICKEVADYFSANAKNFQDMSEVMSGKELTEKYKLGIEVGALKADELAKQKEYLEQYHRAMSIVSSSYNFQPAARPSIEPTGTGLRSKILAGLGIEMNF